MNDVLEKSLYAYTGIINEKTKTLEPNPYSTFFHGTETTTTISLMNLDKNIHDWNKALVWEVSIEKNMIDAAKRILSEISQFNDNWFIRLLNFKNELTLEQLEG